MVRNEKGFTLIELFAVIALVSLIILPTLTALTGNFRVNTVMMDRSTASLKSTQVIDGFNGLRFTNIRNQLNDESPYLLFTQNQGCDALQNTPFTPVDDIITYNNNRASCQKIFDSVVNDKTYSEEQLRVYIYPYAVTDPDEFIAQLDESELPDEVFQEMSRISEGRSIRVLRVIVYIEYSETQNITRTGLMSPRVEVVPSVDDIEE